jgi:hypothetical protein
MGDVWGRRTYHRRDSIWKSARNEMIYEVPAVHGASASLALGANEKRVRDFLSMTADLVYPNMGCNDGPETEIERHTTPVSPG